MKVLNVVQSAFRTLVEEQDDTILWLSQSIKSAGADLSILLTGNTCCYAFGKKSLPPLQVGTWRQTMPVSLKEDLDRLHASGVRVYVVQEELAARALSAAEINPGIMVIPEMQVADLYAAADQVWHW